MSENANAIAQSMFGVFGKKAEDVKLQNESTGSNGMFFNPDAKTAPNQIYRCVIKYLPKLYDLENPNKAETVETTSYWIPEGNSGFRFTSPKSLGKMEKCIVADKFWEWKESSDARLVKLTKRLGYKRQFFALIQIIEDFAKPENKGKLFIYDVPYSIQKKIKATMFPSKDDIKMGAVANNIFDPLEGYPMVMKVSIKNTSEGEFRDYDDCAFNDRMNPRMIVDFEADELKPADEPKTEDQLLDYQKKAIETILAGPSLKDVEYKGVDEAIITRIQKALVNLESGNTGDDEETSNDEKPKETVTNEAETPKADDKTEAKEDKAENIAKTETNDSAQDLINSVMMDQNS